MKQSPKSKVTISQGRIPITKCGGNSWEKIKTNSKMAIRSFKKCGKTAVGIVFKDGKVVINRMKEYAMILP